MKRLCCPICGFRNMSEFLYHGVRRISPDPAHCSDEEWADYLFNRQGITAVKREWWCHLPCNQWFELERDTYTDQIFETLEFGELS